MHEQHLIWFNTRGGRPNLTYEDHLCRLKYLFRFRKSGDLVAHIVQFGDEHTKPHWTKPFESLRSMLAINASWMPTIDVFTTTTVHQVFLNYAKQNIADIWLLQSYLYPANFCGGGIMLYPPNRLSVRPSVSASFPDSNLSSFWPFSSNFAWTLISGKSGLGLQMG